MTKRNLDEGKEFIRATFKGLHKLSKTIYPTEAELDLELAKDLPVNQDAGKIVDFYFDKYLPIIFLDAWSLSKTSKQGQVVYLNIVSFIFIQYLNGDLAANIWHEKIWDKLSLDQKLRFLKTKCVDKGAMFYLAQDNNKKTLKEYQGYFLEVMDAKELNKHDRELFHEYLHRILLESIAQLLKLATEEKPSECLGALFDMLKQTAIAAKSNEPLQEKELWFMHMDGLQMRGKILFLDYFVELCHDLFQESNGPGIQPISQLIALLKTHLSKKEFALFDKLFKDKYEQLLTTDNMQPAWAAFMQKPQPKPATVEQVVITKPEVVDLPTAINNLNVAIKALRNYGLELLENNAAKGEVLTSLADELEDHVTAFPAQPGDADYQLLRDKFEQSINPRAQAIAQYRLNVVTLLKNIVVALTGIGALVLAGYWGYTRYSNGRGRFFWQADTTTSEGLVAGVDNALGKVIR